MKGELGLQAVVAAAPESGQMSWATGNHLFSAYLTMGVKRGDHTYLNLLLEGKIDSERIVMFADYANLLFSYADRNILYSGIYDDQLALWATGKAAFITQGNWLDPSLPGYGATLACGILPYAFMPSDTPGATADSPSYWAVNRNSGSLQGAKLFLNELALSDEGQKTLVEDCGMISPFRSCALVPTTPIAADLYAQMKNHESYAWDWVDMPVSLAANATGAVFELFAKDAVDSERFVALMEAQIAEYTSNY
jgi:raffinose/stachyose/melibiose transport system substrate-binding protein